MVQDISPLSSEENASTSSTLKSNNCELAQKKNCSDMNTGRPVPLKISQDRPGVLHDLDVQHTTQIMEIL